MNFTHTIGAAIVMACGSTAMAGAVVDLAPSQFTGGLSGITNTMMPELIGSEYYDYSQSFSIYGDPASEGGLAPLYEATLLTRIVRSNMTGNLHFNYMIQTPNADLEGQVSHIELSGFSGFQTRVEYRNENSGQNGFEGPTSASRSANGDVLTFDFGGLLDTNEQSKFFFAMVDTDTFTAPSEGVTGSALATIYLISGEKISLNVAGAGNVPTPGALSLFAAAGLVTVRRRR